MKIFSSANGTHLMQTFFFVENHAHTKAEVVLERLFRDRGRQLLLSTNVSKN